MAVGQVAVAGWGVVMGEYRGNTFLEIGRALEQGKTQFLLSAAQMRQIIQIHAEVTEAKNVVVRENWRLTHDRETASRGP
jgi:hypothetical protein